MRWVAINICVLLFRTGENKSFKEVWKGPHSPDLSSGMYYDMLNIVIGALFMAVILALLFFSGW